MVENYSYLSIAIIVALALVVIIYMLRNNIKSLALNVGKLLNLSIHTHEKNETESTELLASMSEETTPEDKDDEALKTLKWIQQEIKEINGSYIHSKSTLKNKEIITLMYTKCTQRLIGTAFFENPNEYGDDLAAFVRPGIEYIRITTDDVCPKESQEEQKRKLGSFQSNARFIVVPSNVEISKLGGLFCEMNDNSYLVFIALNNVNNQGENHGLAFCGDTAKKLFQYYESWISL